MALAKSLQTTQGSNPISNGWQSLAAQDERFDELHLRLAQIDVRRDPDAATAFSKRLEALVLEAEGPMRNMKLDALVIEVAASVDRFRRLAALVEAAQGALAEVEVLGPDADLSTIRKELLAAIEDTDETRLTNTTSDAVHAVGRVRAGRAAAARRKRSLRAWRHWVIKSTRLWRPPGLMRVELYLRRPMRIRMGWRLPARLTLNVSSFALWPFRPHFRLLRTWRLKPLGAVTSVDCRSIFSSTQEIW